MKKFKSSYHDIVTFEQILCAWNDFLRGKKNNYDVALYNLHLFSNLKYLYSALYNKSYTHSKYIYFKINDQKPRDIHKATVQDRVVHRLIYNNLYDYFDSKFIYDSYSCRKDKGAHKAILRYEFFSRKVSNNYTKQAFVLKCDIKKCFASVHHDILIELLEKNILDRNICALLRNIIQSFSNGLPLGNLTSQLFINVYLHELDMFIKQELKQKHYIRYADDFVIFQNDIKELKIILYKIKNFLIEKLKLDLHTKTSIQTVYSGVDFLGWTHFPKHRILRTSTKKRVIRGLEYGNQKIASSYLGLLKWGNTHKIKSKYLADSDILYTL